MRIPVARPSKSSGSRPLSGSSITCLFSTTLPMVLVAVSSRMADAPRNAGYVPLIGEVDEAAPGRLRATQASRFISLNPVAATMTRYLPGSSAVMDRASVITYRDAGDAGFDVSGNHFRGRHHGTARIGHGAGELCSLAETAGGKDSGKHGESNARDIKAHRGVLSKNYGSNVDWIGSWGPRRSLEIQQSSLLTYRVGL